MTFLYILPIISFFIGVFHLLEGYANGYYKADIIEGWAYIVILVILTGYLYLRVGW